MPYQIKLNGEEEYYSSSNIEAISYTKHNNLLDKIKHKYPKGKLVISFKNGGKYTYNIGIEAFKELERRAKKEFVKQNPEETTGKFYSRRNRKPNFRSKFYPRLRRNEDAYVTKR